MISIFKIIRENIKPILFFHITINVLINNINILLNKYIYSHNVIQNDAQIIGIICVLYILFEIICTLHKYFFLEKELIFFQTKIHNSLEKFVNDSIEKFPWNEQRQILQNNDFDRIKNKTVYSILNFSETIISDIVNIIILIICIIGHISFDFTGTLYYLCTLPIIFILSKYEYINNVDKYNKIWQKYRYYSSNQYYSLIHLQGEKIFKKMYNCINEYNNIISQEKHEISKNTESIKLMINFVITINLIAKIIYADNIINIFIHFQLITHIKNGIISTQNIYKKYTDIKLESGKLQHLLKCENPRKNIIHIKNFDKVVVHKLYYKYDNNKNFEINLRNKLCFECGKIIRLEGPSGSGKSSFMDILSGIIPSNQYNHEIYIDDKMNKYGFEAIIPHRIYAEQSNPNNWNESIQNIIIGENIFEMNILSLVIKLSECGDFLNLKNLNSLAINLSGGQKGRIIIAKILYHAIISNSKFFILDEIDKSLQSNLAVNIVKNIIKYCRDNKICLIIAVHCEEAKNLNYDQVLKFNNGEISSY
ncbi:ABC transporter [Acanthamoeba polyphaga moumouvirus]|uniref:MdlB[COG1132], ABC-type multidrug transport system n=1 Tax=Acanthamoeba polyphaga moumouvirus TaxID=1269028 RepID=L7RFR4_9VIRU|nr:ABC transporter [Acanthamoeba polyphaga moumouvirus]AGC01685.1 MdlB[COG1132], ABC-type multidrug transport system [Acanthamoeba polyphaga moumouvirus]AQN68023.1 mdlB [Saudi moumouvirus]